MSIKKVILVTAIGTTTATSIIQQLENVRKEFFLIGADINPASEIVTSKDVDKFYIFPSSIDEEEKYLKFVLDFCKRHNVEYFFPVIDEEVVNCSINKNKFEEIGVKLCIPNHELITVCHYKNSFSKWIKENFPDIWIKSYYDISEIDKADFPIFIKPVVGRASNECKLIYSIDELRKITNLHKYVVQEYIDGAIITVDIIRNAKYEQIEIIQRKELLRNKNGCGIAVEIVNYEYINKLCKRLAKELNLNGVINAEFFMYDGTFKIIEINPRFSAGSIFSYMAGCNLAINELKIADSKECEFKSISVGKHYARRYEAYEL